MHSSRHLSSATENKLLKEPLVQTHIPLPDIKGTRYGHKCVLTGGKVDIQSITEATLQVLSRSGDINLGKIKASYVDLASGGTYLLP